MDTIQEALALVGDEPISNLFEFVEIVQESTDKSKDVVRWFDATNIAVDVGRAIYRYAESKERICQG